MLSPEQFSKLVDLLLRGGEALLVILVIPYFIWRAKRYSTTKEVETHQTILGNATAPAVAAVYSETVKDLKDPAKDGEWTDAAKLAARNAAVDKVLVAFPASSAFLEAHGVHVRPMLEQGVERGVVALDAILDAASGDKAVTKAADAVTKAVEATSPEASPTPSEPPTP